MVDVKLLKSEMAKCGLTRGELCEKVKMSQSTFSRRIKHGIYADG